MSRLQKRIAAVSISAVGVALICLYQNCSPSPSTEFASSQPKEASSTIVAAPPTSSYSGGNGGGYDGKPYVQPDLTQSCKDGDGAKSRILEKTGSYSLIRIDCQNLATPQPVTVTSLPISTSPLDAIVYDNKIFDSQAAIVSGTQRPTKTYCRQNSLPATITVPQTVGSNFNVELLVSVSNTDLVATMTFDDNSTSDAYTTAANKVGSASVAPLAGSYSYNVGGQQLSLNFSGGSVQAQASNLSVTDTDTPSVTGTLVNFNSSITSCWSN